jgi:two-component system sensor histidine kinase PilS (NtrC family)
VTVSARRLPIFDAISGERLRAPDAVTRREISFFGLFRLFEAALLAVFCFSPLAVNRILFVADDTARGVAAAYVVAAVALYLAGRRARGDVRALVFLGFALDLLAASATLTAVQGLDSAIAALLLVNVACAGLLLSAPLAYLFAVLTAFAVGAVFAIGGEGTLIEGALYAAGYLAITILLQILRRHVSETEDLVERQGADLANLTQLNELIIKRMRTGVIVVGADNLVAQVNESAWQLLGSPSPERRVIGDVAPELSRRLYQFRTNGRPDQMPVALAPGLPEVIPRFVRLGAGDADNVIIFLDDTSLLSRQAEQLTLSSLGRLSASIAHEIRNPLAAISYSAQLLAESEDIPEPDQRLVDIVRAQCQRVNAIVENILQLSRRERSRPEPIDVSQWVVSFVEEYRSTHPMEQDELRAIAGARALPALVDASQLQQVVWNLVHNARRYGRLPDEPARIAVVARRVTESGPPVIEVVDRGPGIPARVAGQIFEPFYTTNEHGTGLGLYIARQLCEANQGALEYVPVAGGGSCFRITLQPASRSGEVGTGRMPATAATAVPERARLG